MIIPSLLSKQISDKSLERSHSIEVPCYRWLYIVYQTQIDPTRNLSSFSCNMLPDRPSQHTTYLFHFLLISCNYILFFTTFLSTLCILWVFLCPHIYGKDCILGCIQSLRIPSSISLMCCAFIGHEYKDYRLFQEVLVTW